MTLDRNHLARRISWASYLLYIACLALPAFTAVSTGSQAWGLSLLFVGPFGIIAGDVYWLANPLLWYAWTRMHGEDCDFSFAVACVAFVVALSFLMGKSVHMADAGESDYHVMIGYYVWLASIAACAISARVFDPTVGRSEGSVREP